MSFRAYACNCLVAVLLAGLSTPAAAADPSLYSATTIVTGRDNLAERTRGTSEALAEVLMKLTADRGIVEEPSAVEALANAEELVAGFDYTDRKAGLQISDEQGSRDRSFLFDVSFDQTRVDALIAKLGAETWEGPRPVVKVGLSVTDAGGLFEVTQTSERGYGQREVLLAEAKRSGLPLLLPGAPGAGGARAAGAVLSGRMTVTPEGYWDTVWTLNGDGIEESWSVEDATFDRAIADGLWQTAARLKQARG